MKALEETVLAYSESFRGKDVKVTLVFIGGAGAHAITPIKSLKAPHWSYLAELAARQIRRTEPEYAKPEYTDPILLRAGLFIDPLDYEDAMDSVVARIASGKVLPRVPDEPEDEEDLIYEFPQQAKSPN